MHNFLFENVFQIYCVFPTVSLLSIPKKLVYRSRSVCMVYDDDDCLLPTSW
jgi:hypothetical protein